jgi:Ca2+-binding EF-hand superfamily protein
MLEKLFMVAIGFCVLSVAQADDSAKVKEISAKFKAADKNADGQLSLDEAKAGMPRVAKGFDKIDVEKKGYVTLEQIIAMAN